LGNGNKVFDVSDPDTGQTFIICLDGQIRADLSKHCELKAETLSSAAMWHWTIPPQRTSLCNAA